jgi:hypothetical protein
VSASAAHDIIGKLGCVSSKSVLAEQGSAILKHSVIVKDAGGAYKIEMRTVRPKNNNLTSEGFRVGGIECGVGALPCKGPMGVLKFSGGAEGALGPSCLSRLRIQG